MTKEEATSQFNERFSKLSSNFTNSDASSIDSGPYRRNTVRRDSHSSEGDKDMSEVD